MIWLPNYWELHGFSSTLCEKNMANLCVFPYFSCSMEIHFSLILGTVWISALPEIFRKPKNLKYLCFPILFPYYGNPLFLCFWNCMDFCFTKNIWETHNFQMSVFSHTFPLSLKCKISAIWLVEHSVRISDIFSCYRANINVMWNAGKRGGIYKTFESALTWNIH